MDLIILIAIAVLALVIYMLLIIDEFCKTKCKFFCKYFGWHKDPDRITLDGRGYTGKCPRCGKEVIQDSSGSWF